jgi:16S rRNA (cytidine1402-2'-O)-methyltransferase
MNLGKLQIIATPIGNLADLTQRASEALAAADVIACEDTRHSRHLLAHHGVDRPLVSLHEHNEAMRSAQLVQEMLAGKTVAYISDAGMPGVSDPGQRLVSAARKEHLRVEVLPGPSAVLTALIGSGFPADTFFFGGFLPVKSGGREKTLRKALEREETSVFFESPHRIDRTLHFLAENAPERLICVARELTKVYEEYRRGPASEINAHYTKHPAKGEICLVIAGTDLPKWVLGNPPAPAPHPQHG